MANDIVQTIAEARVDARSLSEFVFKPADFMVARRLAPSVRTLQYYVDFFNTLQSNIATSVSAAQSSLNNSVAEAEGKVAYIETTVQDAINNTAVEGGVLADTFVTATANGVGTVARTQRGKNSDTVSVKDFGAKGDDNQTLFPITPYSAGGTTITQQTRDGIAFNAAVDYLKSKGGGSLYVPAGIYRIYATIKIIEFPIHLYGDGAASVLKNCTNSPTDKHGFGLVDIRPTDVVTDVSVSDLKLDGDGYNRSKPTAEFFSYPLGLTGKVRGRFTNLVIVNGTIDCLYVNVYSPAKLAAGEELSNVFTNCYLNDSFRNTLSVISGNNTSFVNCYISGGGYVHGGISPRYTVDIEPNSASTDYHIRNLKFTNCVFSRAIATIVGGTWCETVFTNCTIDASQKHPSNANDPFSPYGILLSSLGNWRLIGCRIIGDKVNKLTKNYCYGNTNENSEFNDNGGVFLDSCEFEFCGMEAQGRRLDIDNVVFKNSFQPFIILKGGSIDKFDLRIKNLKLVNVFGNSITQNSSFGVTGGYLGSTVINDLYIGVDTLMLNRMFKPTDFAQPNYFGYYGQGFINSAAAGHKTIINNVHCEGFYKRLDAFRGTTSIGRDWSTPSLPPKDTNTSQYSMTANVVSGTVAANELVNKSVTGSVSYTDVPESRILGGRATVSYRNCTMWGNFI